MSEPVYVLPEPLRCLPPPMLELVTKQSWGPILWRQLHDRPEQTGGDLSREMEWLEGFRQAIICGDCRRHFTQWMEQNPPDLTSVCRYFRWTVNAHDHVNWRLGRTQVGWRTDLWGECP